MIYTILLLSFRIMYDLHLFTVLYSVHLNTFILFVIYHKLNLYFLFTMIDFFLYWSHLFLIDHPFIINFFN